MSNFIFTPGGKHNLNLSYNHLYSSEFSKDGKYFITGGNSPYSI
jgi:hypothetical protein